MTLSHLAFLYWNIPLYYFLYLPFNYYIFRRLPAMTLSHLASPKGNERQTILDTADSVSPAALQRNTRNDTYLLSNMC